MVDFVIVVSVFMLGACLGWFIGYMSGAEEDYWARVSMEDNWSDLHAASADHQARADRAEKALAELTDVTKRPTARNLKQEELRELCDQIQDIIAAAADHQHRADTAERKLAELLDVTKRPTARNKKG
jgi:hypothetical protein